MTMNKTKYISNGKGWQLASFIMVFLALIFGGITLFASPFWSVVYGKYFGNSGVGMVLDIRDSSVSVNDVRQKAVQVSFRDYERTTDGIPPEVVRDYKVGDSVPIFYYGKNEDVFVLSYPPSLSAIIFNVIFGALTVLLMGLSGLFLTKYRNGREAYEVLSLYGQSDRAIILAIRRSGMKVNNIDYLRIEIEYSGRKGVIPNIHPKRIEGADVGHEIWVKYNSQNPNEFTFPEGKRTPGSY